jgi:hypothetical protein
MGEAITNDPDLSKLGEKEITVPRGAAVTVSDQPPRADSKTEVACERRRWLCASRLFV